MPAAREEISDFMDMSPLAEAGNIPVHFTDDVNGAPTLEWIKKKEPDIIFCFGYSQLFKEELLGIPSMGVVGTHPAALPINRGRHPVIWSLFLGLEESALTFFFLDKGADSGPILSQKKMIIKSSDTSRTIKKKLMETAQKQIEDFLPRLIDGTFVTYEQDDARATYWRKRSRKDGLIDWRMSVEAILNLVRALTKPYPGAEFMHKEKAVILWDAMQYEGQVLKNIEPGKIIGRVEAAPVVKCYDGAIVLQEYEPDVELTLGEYLF